MSPRAVTMPSSLGSLRTKTVVGDVALGADLLVEAQAGAPGFGLGLDLDLGDAEGDEPAQLFGALGDRREPGEGEAGLEGGERLLLLVVPVVVAADDKERRAALDRVGRFQVRVVGARHRMVVLGRRARSAPAAARQDRHRRRWRWRASRSIGARRIMLGLVIALGRAPPAGDRAPAGCLLAGMLSISSRRQSRAASASSFDWYSCASAGAAMQTSTIPRTRAASITPGDAGPQAIIAASASRPS